jgi:hypothetical protein
MGMSLAQCNNAAQTVLSPADLPIGITIINFGNFVGGTIFVSICQSILSSTLQSQLAQKIPDLDVSSVLHAGATDLMKLILRTTKELSTFGIVLLECQPLHFWVPGLWSGSLSKASRLSARRNCHLREVKGVLQQMPVRH